MAEAKTDSDAGPRQALLALAHIQLAALSASATLATDWARIADAAGGRLRHLTADLARSRVAPREALGRALEEYRSYLAQLSDLPQAAGLRFYSELARLRDETAAPPAEGPAARAASSKRRARRAARPRTPPPPRPKTP